MAVVVAAVAVVAVQAMAVRAVVVRAVAVRAKVERAAAVRAVVVRAVVVRAGRSVQGPPLLLMDEQCHSDLSGPVDVGLRQWHQPMCVPMLHGCQPWHALNASRFFAPETPQENLPRISHRILRAYDLV